MGYARFSVRINQIKSNDCPIVPTSLFLHHSKQLSSTESSVCYLIPTSANFPLGTGFSDNHRPKGALFGFNVHVTYMCACAKRQSTITRMRILSPPL